ncbi:MAG TPA: DNRLRE domain-containing protein [Candidatus Nanoarchaeia archaeon]
MRRLPFALVSILVFLFSFLFFVPKTNTAWAAPTTLTATADAMIQSLNPDSKYGSNSHLDVMKSYPPITNPEGKTRSLVKFDLSSIPANATIDSATFSIFLYGCNWTQTVDNLHIGRNKDSWQEYLVSWNNKSSFDTGSVINSTAPCTSVNQYLNYNIKPFVTGWMNGTYPNNGIVMYGNEGAGVSWIKFFYGRENPANKPPKLVLTYTLPGQPTDGNTNDGTEEDGSDTNDKETASKPGEDKSATQSATISAQKATPSTTISEKAKGISGARIALIVALVVILGALTAGYIIYRRRKKLASKKDKEPEKLEENKEEANTQEPSDK